MVITTEYTFILKRFDDCLSQLTYFTCLINNIYKLEFLLTFSVYNKILLIIQKN